MCRDLPGRECREDGQAGRLRAGPASEAVEGALAVLRCVPRGDAAVALLTKVLANILRSPDSDKFRCIIPSPPGQHPRPRCSPPSGCTGSSGIILRQASLNEARLAT